MDITEIKSFLAVTEYRSFTLAAKRVHITQSAMSKRIQKLENELGVRLFIVEGTRITLTEAANHFIPYARQMLAIYNNMLKSFKDKAQAFQYYLVIGASVFVSHYVLPDFLSYLNSAKSNLQLHIKTMGECDIENHINHGLVDLVICPDKEVPSKLFTKIKLWEEHYYLVVSQDHELAKLNKPITLADLANFPAILTERGASLRDRIEFLFQDHELNLNLGFEISTIDGIKALVEHGLGWSVLPKRMISENIAMLETNSLNIHLIFNAYIPKRRMEERGILSFLEYFNKWQHPNPNEEKILW